MGKLISNIPFFRRSEVGGEIIFVFAKGVAGESVAKEEKAAAGATPAPRCSDLYSFSSIFNGWLLHP